MRFRAAMPPGVPPSTPWNTLRGWNSRIIPGPSRRLIRSSWVGVAAKTNIGVPWKQNSQSPSSGTVGTWSGHGSASAARRPDKTSQKRSAYQSCDRSRRSGSQKHASTMRRFGNARLASRKAARLRPSSAVSSPRPIQVPNSSPAR